MSKNTNIILTERLALYKGTIKDFLEVYEFDFKYLRDKNSIEFIKTDPDFINSWFENGIGEHYKLLDETNKFDWIMYLKDTNTPIGNITANNEKIHKQNSELTNYIELSYNLHPKYWKQGYMYEAVTAVIDYLFDKGFESIIIGYADFNEASKSISNKLDFKYLSEETQFYKYLDKEVTVIDTIMTKEKWQNKKEVKLTK